jgi:hypothetical protein
LFLLKSSGDWVQQVQHDHQTERLPVVAAGDVQFINTASRWIAVCSFMNFPPSGISGADIGAGRSKPCKPTLVHQFDAQVDFCADPRGRPCRCHFAKTPQAAWQAADLILAAVSSRACLAASNRRASGRNGSRVAGSNLHATDRPEHDDNDQYQTENAVQARHTDYNNGSD